MLLNNSLNGLMIAFVFGSFVGFIAAIAIGITLKKSVEEKARIGRLDKLKGKEK